MTGSARFTFTQEDLIVAHKAWWTGAARWQSFVKTAGIICLIYAVLAIAAMWDTSPKAKLIGVAVACLVAILLTLVLFGIGFVLLPGRARRAFREHKTLAGEFDYAWDDKGVTIRHERGSTLIPWALLHGWLDGPATLMLYQSSNLFNAIPKRALPPDAVNEIVGYLVAAKVPERKRFGFRATAS